jgi:two-component system KDP operon response regulator KdpE
MANLPRILIIDDDAEIRDILEVMLSKHSFRVLTATSSLEGLQKAYQYHPKAILLDIMMPEMDGLETCRRLREMTDIPIIFITARNRTVDLEAGFAAGADDYITKPFTEAEVRYRLQACLRRAQGADTIEDEFLFPLKDVMLDGNRHELILNGHTVRLAPQEFEVLRVLLRHPGKVVTPDTILLHVWGAEHLGNTELVKQYIYRLRQKIETEPENPHYLHTVWGEGYYFDFDPP